MPPFLVEVDVVPWCAWTDALPLFLYAGGCFAAVVMMFGGCFTLVPLYVSSLLYQHFLGDGVFVLQDQL